LGIGFREEFPDKKSAMKCEKELKSHHERVEILSGI